MIKVDIVSGFLGAGKTTLIKKLIAEVFAGKKIVLIENEFGEIGIDGGFLKDAGINITEMNSGCICCSLVGDFGKALKEVAEQFSPDRIIIEPSGVGKLSDVRKAVEDAAASLNAERSGMSEATCRRAERGGDSTEKAGLELNALTTVADASKIKMYMKNFGEFYNNQIESAATVILSRTQKLSEEKQLAAAAMIREKNPTATIITTPWDELTGEQMLQAMEGTDALAQMLLKEVEDHDEDDDECCCHEHHHDHGEDEDHEHGHHHGHGDEYCHGDHEHDHHDHEDDESHEHHHHEHEEHDHDHDECCRGEHEHHHEHEEDEGHDHEHHHHDHDDECCHDHDGHHHHHHHHADDVFTSWGKETPRKYTKDEVEEILKALGSEETYGTVLRAKGMLPATDGTWIHFDFVPEEYEIRTGAADYTGRFCVIGAKLNEQKLEELFHLA